MKKEQGNLMEKFAEMQKERIAVFPVGVDSKGRAHGYIVRDDRVWYVKDNKPVPVKLK